MAPLLPALSACGAAFRLNPLRMDQTLDDLACPGVRAPALVILLPGAHMTPQELQREGFVRAVRERKLAADVVIADAHLGYVYDGSMFERLHDDVLAPALAQGYRRIWLCGISLGGFVGLGYAMRHPQQIEGVLALAPYLGRRPLVQAVADAGGPAAWRTTARPRDDKDVDHELWMWLSQRPATAPALYLGYGREDRFAQGHALLASTLPAERVSVVPGGHDWAPWQRLWAMWLDRGLLPTVCAE